MCVCGVGTAPNSDLALTHILKQKSIGTTWDRRWTEQRSELLAASALVALVLEKSFLLLHKNK